MIKKNTCHESKCSGGVQVVYLLHTHRNVQRFRTKIDTLQGPGWPAIILDLKELVRPERFELPTPCFVGKCSIQLSYGRTGYTAKFQPSSKSLCTAERNLSMQALIRPQMNSNTTQFATSLS